MCSSDMLVATSSVQNRLFLERSTTTLCMYTQTKHRPPRHPEMHKRIPSAILASIPLEMENLWTPPAVLKYSEVARALDQLMGARHWRQLIATKYEVRRPELLATRHSMNRSKLSLLLRTEFPAPWVFTLRRFEQENITLPEIHKWLRPACEIDRPLAQLIKKHKSRFCTNTILTLSPVEPNRYPTFFTVERRWFYAGRLETYHSRHGKEPAMVVFQRAIQEASA